MGWSNVDHKVVVLLERTRFPVSSRAAEEAPVVPESHTVAPEPLRRRREPELRKWKEPPESTA